MSRVVSCFSNCFGSWGVRTAAEKIRGTGLEYLELALRGHNFGGLVIPESAVVTEKATDEEAAAFVEHLKAHGAKVSGCNVGGANILTPEGVAITQDRIRFAKKWFGVDVVVSGAGQPKDEAEKA
ncbi:MAG: sugar phosphate isomerase/epimerase, partial [Thermoleophilia bacterium]|nr:sugar phosphate isomerase/epimerase [Thermoleophilia bacterium]